MMPSERMTVLEAKRRYVTTPQEPLRWPPPVCAACIIGANFVSLGIIVALIALAIGIARRLMGV